MRSRHKSDISARSHLHLHFPLGCCGKHVTQEKPCRQNLATFEVNSHLYARDCNHWSRSCKGKLVLSIVPASFSFFWKHGWEETTGEEMCWQIINLENKTRRKSGYENKLFDWGFCGEQLGITSKKTRRRSLNLSVRIVTLHHNLTLPP